MTEAEYAHKLREAIKARFGDRCVVLKIHGGPHQERGISDLLLCIAGRFIAVELKQKGEKPTPLQDRFLARIRAAGGGAFVVYTDEPLLTTLDLLDVYEWERRVAA